MKKGIFIILIGLLALSLNAKKTFEWTPLAEKAYRMALQTRFIEAKFYTARLKIEEPDNYIVYHIENYIDFFKIYINEDEDEFRQLEKNKNFRLNKIEDGDVDSPYYLYLQADIRLQWALARLKFEEFATAFFETNKAFKLLEKNVEKFPDFMPNKKDIGILHAMVGTIPDNYKWGVELLTSMNGTIDQGQKEIEQVIKYSNENKFIYDVETLVLYSYVLLHLGNQSKKAWNLLNSGKLDPENSPMDCFVLSNVAMATGKNDYAIELLKKYPTGKAFHPFPYLDFMLGNAKLRRLDKDADIYLKKYVDSFKGRNFIKEAWQKLAWHGLIFNGKTLYKKNINNCISAGYTIVGGDKSALREAKSEEIPDKFLLKARLLFDGGYYKKAHEILKNKDVSGFSGKKSKLEFYYRYGRILHKLNEYEQALKKYQKTIDEGQNESWYFACRAALESGHIYENQKNTEKAKEFYQLCIKINPAEHKTALHQQAQTGLARIGGN